jgi:hypothetical protein
MPGQSPNLGGPVVCFARDTAPGCVVITSMYLYTFQIEQFYCNSNRGYIIPDVNKYVQFILNMYVVTQYFLSWGKGWRYLRNIDSPFLAYCILLHFTIKWALICCSLVTVCFTCW